MLPSYTGPGKYHTAAYRRKSRRDDPPWALLLILVLAGSGVVYTRRRSLAALDDPSSSTAFDRRDLLQRQQRVNDLLEEEAPKEPTLPTSRKTNKNSHAPGFDEKLHKGYDTLPPLPDVTPAELKGGWQFTPSVYDYAANLPGAEVISWEAPRLVMFRSFLAPEEVAHLVGVAQDHLERSSVLSADENEEVNDVRTSFGAWPARDAVINKIYDRIHRVVGVPEPFGEDSYILNYKLNQRYDAHNDNCMDNLNRTRHADEACNSFLKRANGPGCGPGHGGPACGDRIATFILFLKAPTAGGKTVFPSAAITQQRLEAAGEEEIDDGGDAWYCRSPHTLGVAPSPGDAVLFWDYKPRTSGTGTGSFADGTADPTAEPVPGSLHSGCPVLEGEKWIATRWIRSAQFI